MNVSRRYCGYKQHSNRHQPFSLSTALHSNDLCCVSSRLVKEIKEEIKSVLTQNNILTVTQWYVEKRVLQLLGLGYRIVSYIQTFHEYLNYTLCTKLYSKNFVKLPARDQTLNGAPAVWVGVVVGPRYVMCVPYIRSRSHSSGGEQEEAAQRIMYNFLLNTKVTY